MKQTLATGLLIVVGLINGIPVIGIWSASVLESLYAVGRLDGDLLILMRHRALLFGILGAWIVTAAFRPALRPAAMLAAAISMAGFVVLALIQGSFGEKIQGVVWADLVGLAVLGIAFFLGRDSVSRP